MQGTEENPGIVPRALQELFDLKSKMEDKHSFTVKLECYMAELYVSSLIDCLYPSQSKDRPPLEIRED